MLIFLETINVIAILLMLFMLAVILRQQPSKAQTAFVLYNVFTILFVVGIHLELIHSDTIGEAVAGLCVQYIGQAGFLMCLLWFVSEFANFAIPMWVYGLQAFCNVLVLGGIFTVEKNQLFYTSLEILTDGLYNRINIRPGPFWYVHYVHMGAVILMILILCAARYKKSAERQKKRILYIAAGMGAFALELVLKGIGVFGSYNPVVIAMTVMMYCMMMAMVRYSYFGSLHAAVDNAFNHGNEGLIILDEDQRIIFVNQRMDELLPDIHRGSSIDRYPEICELLGGQEKLLHRENAVYELRVEDIIEHGEKAGCMLWLIDQTQALQTMNKLREADEAKTQFLMRVSHELRTPMNAILGMNEMIRRESSEEEIRGYADEVADAGEHMLALVDEVLDTSRLESGKLTISKKAYRIAELLKNVEELIRPQAEKKGLWFSLEADHKLLDGELLLYGDAVHIRQAMVNLLSNAVKYTDRGYVCLKAGIYDEKAGRRLILASADSGIGIREEERGRIFENFGRGSNTGGKDGMGLGLAIVRQLVDAMEGTLTVESDTDKGSTFTVSLPWEEASPEQAALIEEEDSAWTQKAKEDPAEKIPDFQGRVILAVDDKEQNLRVICHLLRRTGITVETALSGKEAAAACQERAYDLILLDHMMPDMDGIETLRQIRQDEEEKNRQTPVIALTANAAKGVEETYREQGFTDYLSKPVDPGKLERMLQHYLGEKSAAGGQPEERTAGMVKSPEWIKRLEKYGIDTGEGMRYADEDAAFYEEMLRLFAGQAAEKQTGLEELLDSLRGIAAGETDPEAEEKLYDQIVGVCHTLKGEARGLGAAELGESFYRMELAARVRDRMQLEEFGQKARSQWKKTVEGIRLVCSV